MFSQAIYSDFCGMIQEDWLTLKLIVDGVCVNRTKVRHLSLIFPERCIDCLCSILYMELFVDTVDMLAYRAGGDV